MQISRYKPQSTNLFQLTFSCDIPSILVAFLNFIFESELGSENRPMSEPFQREIDIEKNLQEFFD